MQTQIWVKVANFSLDACGSPILQDLMSQGAILSNWNDKTPYQQID